MKKDILQLVAIGTLVAIFMGLCFFFFLALQPFKIPTITPKKIPILNPDKKIIRGGLLSTDLNYCIYKNVPTTTTRRLEQIGDSQRVYLFSTSIASPKVGCNRIVVQAPIPPDILPGHYKIVTVSVYVVNPLKTVTATFESEEFEIIEK